MGKRKLLSSLLIGYSALLFSQSFEFSAAPHFDQSNNIREYLSKMASNITQSSLKDIHNLEDWESVRKQRRKELVEMLGLQGKPVDGKRQPLKVTKTDVIQKEGYRIEKLYYESLPGLYVPANLYIPDGVTKPVPAILYVCGHAHTQKHHYQSHAKSLVKNGFVCLIIETIQRGEVKGEHLGAYENGWFHWYSKGYNPGGVEVWNGIRGLDLLAQMPEVDEDKLGVTGISGGGSQSWYLPAIDNRVKAAAAVGGAGSLEGQVTSRTIDDHCDCMMPINTYGIDFPDIGALIAPRPFMIAQTTDDLYYSFESVQTLYKKIKPIYSLYGQLGNLSMKSARGWHSYGINEELRADVLAFFRRELKGEKTTAEAIGRVAINEEDSDEQLKTYINGAPKDDRTKTVQDGFVSLASPPVINDWQQFEEYKNEVITFLKEKTFGAFPKEPQPLDIRLEHRSLNRAELQRFDYSFVAEKGWRLKFLLRKADVAANDHPVLLVLRSPAETPGGYETLVSGARQQMDVAFFDARGIGETGWSPTLQWHVRRASAWTGRTLASMRVYDVLRCLEALRKLPGIDSKRIHIAAQGEMAVVAAYAALLDGNIKALILKDPPATQNTPSNPNGTGEAIEMLNSLRITDVAEVTGLGLPSELILMGDVPRTYEWPKNLYKKLNVSDSYRRVEKLSDWFDH